MSIQQAAQAAVAVFPADIAVATPAGVYPLPVVMVAISGAETGGTWDPQAAGDCGLGGPSCGTCLFGGTGATSWGLWQIHNVHSAYLTQQTGSSNPCVWAQWLFNPRHNAEAAWALWTGNVSTFLRNWTTWNTQRYLTYLPQAVQAVQAVTAASMPNPWWLVAVGVAGIVAGGSVLWFAVRPQDWAALETWEHEELHRTTRTRVRASLRR